MTQRIAAALLALMCLFGSTSVLAWKLVDGKASLNSVEGDYCKLWEMDAAAIMMAWQEKEPRVSVYPSDQYQKPDATTWRLRTVLLKEALATSQKATEEERQKDITEFVKRTRIKCVKLILKTPPTQ